MTGMQVFLVFLVAVCTVLYFRTKLITSTVILGIALLGLSYLSGFTIGTFFAWLFFFALTIPLNYIPWRRRYFSKWVLEKFRTEMPSMSRTEREAIAAGTVTWEANIFSGAPNWHDLLSLPQAELTAEEQAFLDGPVETLCSMLDDWDITHRRADLPPDIWQYLKDQGFFGLIIPKEYGGKGFSAFMHSQVTVKLSGRCITASTTVSVPNSLGPAELLLEYGTDEQKQYYLPRLARGEEVPCFALTSPEAGSDASAMTDHGIVCWGEYQGKKTLGIRLNFNKRYITLAPIATVIGLAFKLYDPEFLLGKKHDVGITCALIPRQTPGITVGRRHFPLDTPFQNGPIQGESVFIPVSFIIGGEAQAGNGWGMLMECLAGGRAITLPSSTLGGAKVLSYATGAYARIRRQFHLPIGFFEGIEEPLARIGAFTYLMDAARSFVIASIDRGEKPAVASAIVKYHVTELGRRVCCDAMDVHGGKGICLGPNNYLGRGYESSPIAITVEGANILTRNLIIFGQGAIRCHPYIFKEMQAAQMPPGEESLLIFDRLLTKHIGYACSNVVRSFFLSLTSGLLVRAPSGKLRRYFQQASRFSAAFALIADVSMLTMGSALKRKEYLSARLGDILSYLFLLSAILKHYYDQGQIREDLPVVRYAAEHCLFEVQERFNEILRNYPNRLIALALRVLIFPLGQHFTRPRDRFHHKIARLLIEPSSTRQRLAAGAYLSPKHNVLADLQDALIKSIMSESIAKTIREASTQGLISGYTTKERAQSALDQDIITMEQFDIYLQAEAARAKVIAVDDFAPEELVRNAEIVTVD